jgi:hypothetical protein
MIDKDLISPYAPAPTEPLTPWTTRAIDRLAVNMWSLLGALVLVTSTGLWLLSAAAYLFAAGDGVGFVLTTIIEPTLVGVVTVCCLGSELVDDDDEGRPVRAALVLGWAHAALLLLATVAISVLA